MDDDPHILKAYERRLRRRFQVETALCSEEGLTAVNFLGPFAVVVSDMTMPRESGAEFLEKLLQVSPDSIRIMLTGNADQGTAVEAVNRAQVYRFLNKPCEADELEDAIADALIEYRKQQSNREFMKQATNGLITMLKRIVELADPQAYSRSERLMLLAREHAKAKGDEDSWELETAASLSQVGVVRDCRRPLTNEDMQGVDNADSGFLSDNGYQIASALIGEAPQLNEISNIVALLSADSEQETQDCGRVHSKAAALRTLIAFDELTHEKGLSSSEALLHLENCSSNKKDDVLDTLRVIVAERDARRLVEVNIEQLSESMTLVADVMTVEGTVLVAKGHDVSAQLISRLKSYAVSHELQMPIHVQLAEEDGPVEEYLTAGSC